MRNFNEGGESSSKQVSRRRFLRTTAAGLTALGTMAAVPSWVSGGRAEAAAVEQSETAGYIPDTPVVAYIRDAARGEVVLMVGTKEVIRKDPGLVSHLVRSCDA